MTIQIPNPKMSDIQMFGMTIMSGSEYWAGLTLNHVFLFLLREKFEILPERWKALLAFFYALAVSWVTAFVMVIVHDRVTVFLFDHRQCSFCGCPPLSTLIGLSQEERLPHTRQCKRC